MAKGDDSRVRKGIESNDQYFRSQQQPLVNTAGYNYGRSTETNFGDYQDIMNRYRNIAGGNAGDGSEGGSGGVGYTDPFNSYAGYVDFSKTGGYSRDDISNMRARGVAPMRAVYANAEREMNRQRALQGGYSPNFMAASAKMAREQSQGQSDAMTNLNASLAEMIQRGRLQGLQGMTGIENARMQGDLAASASGASAANADIANQLRALQGMSALYGTTPGMSELFGNQALQGVNMGGNYMNQSMGNRIMGAQLPSTFDTTMGRIGQIGDMVGGAVYPW